MGKYIDRVERREQYTCARICVELDLEVGIPESIKLIVTDWSHVQELDYEQLSFKCRQCHGYGHFSRSCKKKAEKEVVKEKGEQLTQVQKANTTKHGNSSKGKELKWGWVVTPNSRKMK